jgi:catechol 2,3-dioxygenase-like lactoylglutathione lyase family enzyme
MSDLGFTHVALMVGDLDTSIAFYAKYANMQVVHQRQDASGSRVAWVSDQTRPFVIVLVQVPRFIPRWLLRLITKVLVPFEHLGVGCPRRDDVDRLSAEAKSDGCLRLSPRDYGPPVGYFAFLSDPDGHTLEISHGQEVGLATHAVK